MLHNPLDPISEGKRGILTNGQPRISIHCGQAMRPGEASPVSLLAVTKATREAAVMSDKSRVNWRTLRCYGLSPTVGGINEIILVSYRPPEAGQPPASKVLTHHSQPASLGAWS